MHKGYIARSVESQDCFKLNITCLSHPGIVHIQILNGCSAKPLRGHHALVWMVGFRMAGFMLSGSGIRVFVLGNVELGRGGWGKVQFNVGAWCGCGRDGMWRGAGVVGYIVY